MEDFSTEHLTTFIPGQNLNGWTLEENDLLALPNDPNYGYSSVGILRDIIIKALNFNREKYLKTKDKKYWWQMIQLLPSSYNQRRTVMLNYEVLANIYKSRKNHKLDEWRDFCKWIETLPYSELITGDGEEHDTSFWDDAVVVMNDMTHAQKELAIEYLKQKLENEKGIIIAESNG